MQFDTSVFDDIRNDADTLGGMLLEINGEIPLSTEIPAPVKATVYFALRINSEAIFSFSLSIITI
jgi:hypothetical protein